MNRRIVLYTRPGCHLCDDAKAFLKAAGASWSEVDIDRDRDLLASYGERVPVVEVDGRVVAEGNLEGVPLRRLLEA